MEALMDGPLPPTPSYPPTPQIPGPAPFSGLLGPPENQTTLLAASFSARCREGKSPDEINKSK